MVSEPLECRNLRILCRFRVISQTDFHSARQPNDDNDLPHMKLSLIIYCQLFSKICLLINRHLSANLQLECMTNAASGG